MGKKKEFADEASGKKRQKLPAEIRVEGQSFVFDSAKMLVESGVIADRLKGFVKELKKLDDALYDNIDKGVTEGKRANMLSASLEESKQTGQMAIFRKHSVACGIYAEIVEAVPMDKLEQVRAAIWKAVGGATKDRFTGSKPKAKDEKAAEGAEGVETPAELGSEATEPADDGKSQAAG